MATLAVASIADKFPVGTTVGAYARAGWPITTAPSGAPAGSAVGTGVVGSGGSLSIAGLAYDTRYMLAASIDGVWRYVNARTGTDPALGAVSSAEMAAAIAAAQTGDEPLDSDLQAIAALSTTSFGRSLLTVADAAGAVAAIGAQPADADLTAIAALSTTATGRSLLAAADASALRTILALGTAATHAHGDYDVAGAAAAAQAASQPLDSDLTAIAALATTAYGRAFLALADAAAARAALGLGTAATHADGDYDVSGAAAAVQALLTAQQAAYVFVRERGGISSGGDTAVSRVMPSGMGALTALSAATAAQSSIWLNPANYAVAGRTTTLRLTAAALVNDTAPGASYLIELCPVNTVSGGAGTMAVTVGAAVASVNLVTPAANATGGANVQTSADVNFPAAGAYTLVATNSAVVSALSRVQLLAQLHARTTA